MCDGKVYVCCVCVVVLLCFPIQVVNFQLVVGVACSCEKCVYAFYVLCVAFDGVECVVMSDEVAEYGLVEYSGFGCSSMECQEVGLPVLEFFVFWWFFVSVL